MSGAWSQLEQLLTCAICLDRFRNPKLLPCQHTFCGEPCMEGLVDYARRQIKCPECRAEHRIPYDGVQSFKNNVTLIRFLDLHRSITGEEPEPLPSQMDRCSVCGEKSCCVRCAHCDKKVCDECRAAHLDILRREIHRINTQIRRGLDKLSEHAQQSDKGGEKLLQTTAQIRDEITESVRRLIKDLKDKEAKLLEELDEFVVTETKNTAKLKEDFDTELTTITSNCELAEEHITDADEWTDVELMEYKDIFLKTLDFLRNLDPDSMDYTRKIKYIQKVDLDMMRRSAADFGEIKISQPVSNFNQPLSPSDSTSNLSVPQSSLMRSQSDHRLAAQFATGARSSQRSDPLQRSYLDVTGQNRYGSDSERERGSSPPGKRFGSVHERTSRFGRNNDNNDFSYTRGWPRPGDSDYEPSNSANFRSRFMRERIRERTGNAGDDHSFEEHDDVASPAHRVRFQEESTLPSAKQKLFDTEEMANMRAPLSGLVKLIDSPHVMERLHQNQIKAKQKEAEAKENESATTFSNNSGNNVSSAPAPTPAPIHRPSRQISEDEIEKQKKQNQAAFSQSQQQQQQNQGSTPTTTTMPTTPVSPNAPTAQPQQPKNKNSYGTSNDSTTGGGGGGGSFHQPQSPSIQATNRRIQAIQKEDKHSPSSSDDNNSESGDMDDDVQTPTPANNSAMSGISRRRIYASTHNNNNNSNNSTSGTTTGSNAIGGSGSLTNSFSQSIDYNDTGNRTNKYHPLTSATLNSGGGNNNNPSYPQFHAVQGSYFNNAQRAPISRYGPDESINPNVSPYSVYRRPSRDELRDEPNASSINQASATTPYYSSQYGLSRRGSVNRRNQDHHDNLAATILNDQQDSYGAGNGSTSSTTGRYVQPSTTRDRYGTSAWSKNRLAKSKSSHTVAYDDSDDESNGLANPLSPSAISSSSFKSRFSTNPTSNSGNVVDPNPDRFSTRRTSRSGYTYRTREPSPEEEGAGSVTQYLINKYGTRSTKSTALSKSKSSHVIFGRSLSSSDEDVAVNPPTKYRRESSTTDYSYKSQIGLSYPRQLYMQKKRVMMKIGSRGTNPSCFTWPRGVACAPDNGIVVADSSNHRIQVFDSTGRFQFEFGSYGSGEGEFDCLAGVTVNRIGHFIVSDRYNHRVQVFDSSGRFLRAFGSEGRSDGKFSYPWGIATDALGFIYVCDKENHRIQVFQSDGTFVGKFGSIGSRAGMLEHPHYIAVSNMNRIIVSDSNNHRIQTFDINGRSISMFGTEGSGDGQFKFPRGVAVDENGFVIVGDSGNNRIQIFNPDGTFLKAFGQWGSGEGEFKGLEGVAISSTGNILVCDRENHRIQVF